MGLWDRFKKAVTSAARSVADVLGFERSPPPPRAAPPASTTPAAPAAPPPPPPPLPTLYDEAERAELLEEMGPLDEDEDDDDGDDVDAIEWEQSMIALRDAGVDEEILETLERIYDDEDGDLDAEGMAVIEADENYTGQK